jgi:hypothetical protein
MSYGILKGAEVVAEFAAPIKVLSNEPVFVNDSLSLKRRALRRSSQRWEIETALVPLTDNAEKLMGHVILKGSHTPFEIQFPQNYGIQLKEFATAGATAAGTANSTTVSVVGLTGKIREYTFISFANHSKVYMTTADRDGDGTLNIFPRLMKAVPAGTPMFYGRSDVKGSFMYNTDSLKGMQYTDGVLMDLGVMKLVEAL